MKQGRRLGITALIAASLIVVLLIVNGAAAVKATGALAAAGQAEKKTKTAETGLKKAQGSINHLQHDVLPGLETARKESEALARKADSDRKTAEAASQTANERTRHAISRMQTAQSATQLAEAAKQKAEGLKRIAERQTSRAVFDTHAVMGQRATLLAKDSALDYGFDLESDRLKSLKLGIAACQGQRVPDEAFHGLYDALTSHRELVAIPSLFGRLLFIRATSDPKHVLVFPAFGESFAPNTSAPYLLNTSTAQLQKLESADTNFTSNLATSLASTAPVLAVPNRLHDMDVFSATTGKVLYHVTTLGLVVGSALSSDGKRLATLEENDRCTIWTLGSGKAALLWQRTLVRASTVVFSGDSQFVLTTDGTSLIVANTSSGTVIRTIALPTEPKSTDDVPQTNYTNLIDKAAAEINRRYSRPDMIAEPHSSRVLVGGRSQTYYFEASSGELLEKLGGSIRSRRKPNAGDIPVPTPSIVAWNTQKIYLFDDNDEPASFNLAEGVRNSVETGLSLDRSVDGVREAKWVITNPRYPGIIASIENGLVALNDAGDYRYRLSGGLGSLGFESGEFTSDGEGLVTSNSGHLSIWTASKVPCLSSRSLRGNRFEPTMANALYDNSFGPIAWSDANSNLGEDEMYLRSTSEPDPFPYSHKGKIIAIRRFRSASIDRIVAEYRLFEGQKLTGGFDLQDFSGRNLSRTFLICSYGTSSHFRENFFTASAPKGWQGSVLSKNGNLFIYETSGGTSKVQDLISRRLIASETTASRWKNCGFCSSCNLFWYQESSGKLVITGISKQGFVAGVFKNRVDLVDVSPDRHRVLLISDRNQSWAGFARVVKLDNVSSSLSLPATVWDTQRCCQAFSPNGDVLAISLNDQAPCLYSTITGKLVADTSLSGGTPWCTSIVFSGDGRSVFARNPISTYTAWYSTLSGLQLAQFPGDVFQTSADGKTFSLYSDGTIYTMACTVAGLLQIADQHLKLSGVSDALLQTWGPLKPKTAPAKSTVPAKIGLNSPSAP